MTIQTVLRISQILRLFSSARPRLGVTDIAASLGLAKSTAFNLVNSLEKVGFLYQDRETRKYRLGLALYELGTNLAATLEINQKARAPLHRMASQTQLYCRVGILHRDYILVTLEVAPYFSAFLSHQLGPTSRVYCGPLGPVLLAYMDIEEVLGILNRIELERFTPNTITDPDLILLELKEIRRKGYYISKEQMNPGFGALGAPVFDSTGAAVAALAMTGELDHVLGPELGGLTGILLQTAAEISHLMGYVPGVNRSGAG